MWVIHKYVPLKQKLDWHSFCFFPAYRKQSHTCKSLASCKTLFEKVRQSCPLIMIRKYFRRIDCQLSVYRQGYNGPQSEVLMKKYKSHRCIPRRAAMDVDVLTAWCTCTTGCLFFLSFWLVEIPLPISIPFGPHILVLVDSRSPSSPLSIHLTACLIPPIFPACFVCRSLEVHTCHLFRSHFLSSYMPLLSFHNLMNQEIHGYGSQNFGWKKKKKKNLVID